MRDIDILFVIEEDGFKKNIRVLHQKFVEEIESWV